MDELSIMDVETYQDLDQAKKALADEKAVVISYKDARVRSTTQIRMFLKQLQTRQVLRTSTARGH